MNTTNICGATEIKITVY